MGAIDVASVTEKMKAAAAKSTPLQPHVITDAGAYLQLAEKIMATGELPAPAVEQLDKLLDELFPPPGPLPSPDQVVGELQMLIESLDRFTSAGVLLDKLPWSMRWEALNRLAYKAPGIESRSYLRLFYDQALQQVNFNQTHIAAAAAELMLHDKRTVSNSNFDVFAQLCERLVYLEMRDSLEILDRLGLEPLAAEGAMAALTAVSSDPEYGAPGYPPDDYDEPDGGVGPDDGGTPDGGTPGDGGSPDGGVAPMAPQQSRTANMKSAAGSSGPMTRGAAATPPPTPPTPPPWRPPKNMPFGDWDKPKNMPFFFYLGNAAHTAIAAYYLSRHPKPGHEVYLNISTVMSIVRAMEAAYHFKAGRIRAALSRSKPDIFDFSMEHGMPPGWVYEIKPMSLARVAEFEAVFYTMALTLAGVPVLPGPVRAPGTYGTVPAPGGWFQFWTPAPGAIVYRWHRPTRLELERRKQEKLERQSTAKLEAMAAALGVSVGVMALMLALLEFLKVVGWVALLATG